MTKPTKWLCAQRRLRSAWASAQSDKSSLCAQWVAKDPSFLHADSEDSDQTGRMPRLIWVFAGHAVILLVLSCRGSFIFTAMSQISSNLDILRGIPGYKVILRALIKAQIQLLVTFTFSWAHPVTKNPRNLDTWKFCCNHPRIRTRCHREMCPKDVDGMTNSVEPDQTAPWSGSTLFAQLLVNFALGHARLIHLCHPY